MNEGRGIAGNGARNLGHRRYTSRQKYLPVLIVCGAVLIFLIPLGFRPGLGIGALLLMFVVLALIKAVGRRIDQSVKEERRAIRGAKGEELIGAMLEGLGDRFLVFHDLPSPYGNIDHLVISKETGVFLIETKAHGGRVSVLIGEIRVNQRPPEKDFIAQVARNTAWLRAQLEAKLSTKVWIQPILVFTNARVEKPWLIRNIQVIPKAFLLNTISRSSRSGGALKLWENKEVLAEIFPTVWFPPKADLIPSPSTLPPSPHLKAGSSLELVTSSVPKNSNLQISSDSKPTVQKELPSSVRRTRLGAIYRLGSPNVQKPAKGEDVGNLDKSDAQGDDSGG
jgi:Nuclease-related domain